MLRIEHKLIYVVKLIAEESQNRFNLWTDGQRYNLANLVEETDGGKSYWASCWEEVESEQRKYGDIMKKKKEKTDSWNWFQEVSEEGG